MRKGFTLIELLAVIVILAIIALIATPIILEIISNVKKEAFRNTAYGIIDAARTEYMESMLSNELSTNIAFTYNNKVEYSDITGKSLSYSGEKPKYGTVLLTSTGDIAIAIHDGTNCAYKSFSDQEVSIEEMVLSDCSIDYSVTKGVNVPKLAEGMIPIKWDGSKWIETTVSDKDWYSYDPINKKWANAKTADGSMWVWIPRYAYQIATNYHTYIDNNTAGIINVKFLKNSSNTASDGSSVDISPTYSSADTQSNFIVHPAFNFGGTQITGIWVAKFETSVADRNDLCYTNGNSTNCNKTALVPKIIPNVKSWRYISVGNMFTVSRNMETNSIYGWSTASGLKTDGTFTNDNNDIDTHMMKNIEWGAVAYLSQSTYGKNAKITINELDYYTGGGTGNAYVTNIDQSTTGNIYGIYDMSGGATEYVMANYNNIEENAGLIPNNINSKYIDIYPTTDNGYTASIYGDAIYETCGPQSGDYPCWYGENSYIIDSDYPWLLRGGYLGDGSYAGTFNFYGALGGARQYDSWRIVLLVGKGL